MDRQPVQSSNLRSIGYDSGLKILEVEFHTWGIYQYVNVPLEIFTGLINASSKGTFHHRFIKNIFPHRRVA